MKRILDIGNTKYFRLESFKKRFQFIMLIIVISQILIITTMLFSYYRNKKRIEIHDDVHLIMNHFIRIKTDSLKLVSISPLNKTYPVWKESSEEFRLQVNRSVINNKVLEYEMERSGNEQILENFKLVWYDLNHQITLVDSVLEKLEKSNNQAWENSLFANHEDLALFDRYLIKDSIDEINHLNSQISMLFQNLLESLYNELSVTNNRLFKTISISTIVIVFLTSVIMNTALILIFLSILHKQNEINSQNKKTKNAIILALAHQAELRDNETGLHIERTSIYVELLAKELRKQEKYSSYLTDQYINELKISAPLHDIGKVGIRDIILQKPGSLTSDEFEEMKKHAVLGAETLRLASERLTFSTFLTIAIRLTEHHHEKWDGSGYPAGLKGDQIPISARLMALADVYDALRTKRVYKPSFSHEKSREIILAGAGKHFDPDLIGCFLNIEEEIKEISISLQDSEGF